MPLVGPIPLWVHAHIFFVSLHPFQPTPRPVLFYEQTAALIDLKRLAKPQQISRVTDRATRPPTDQASHRPIPNAPMVASTSWKRVWCSPSTSSALGIPTATPHFEDGDLLKAVSTGVPSSVTASKLPSREALIWAHKSGETGFPRKRLISCERATTMPPVLVA